MGAVIALLAAFMFKKGGAAKADIRPTATAPLKPTGFQFVKTAAPPNPWFAPGSPSGGGIQPAVGNNPPPGGMTAQQVKDSIEAKADAAYNAAKHKGEEFAKNAAAGAAAAGCAAIGLGPASPLCAVGGRYVAGKIIDEVLPYTDDAYDWTKDQIGDVANKIEDAGEAVADFFGF